MVCAAPIASSRSRFSSEEEVAITMAPIALASCRAAIDTPPVPSTSTVSPAFKGPLTISARQAVRPAVVMVAASACDHPFGAWVKKMRRRVPPHSRA